MLTRTVNVILGTTLTAMLLAAAAAQVAGQCIPHAVPRSPKMSYRITNWSQAWMDPGLARRTNRVIIRNPGGSVGIRVERTNAAPVALHYSLDGRAWQPLCAISNGVEVICNAAGPVALFRISE